MPLQRGPTLGTPVDLRRLTLVLEEGWWVKCRVWLIEPDGVRPHGIRYEPTVQGRGSRRVYGYGNAHAVQWSGGRSVNQAREVDHVRRGPKNPGQPHAFESAGRLAEDFWKGVYAIISENP